MLFKKELDSKPVYNEKYVKIIYNIMKVKAKQISYYTFLSVILIDCVFKIDKNYYPQVVLQACKYIVRKKRLKNMLMMI